jgi:hypothetical protein
VAAPSYVHPSAPRNLPVCPRSIHAAIAALPYDVAVEVEAAFEVR